MDDDNSNNPSPGNNNGQPPPSSYRIRRPSASIISSTTNSPMFQAPTNPNLQPPPSPLALAVAHHSRQRQNNQNNIIFNNNNNNFGSGDIDDDVVQPSSNSNSRGGRSSANSSATSSSYNANNNRPQSPLGSPDSTAYWAPSPSPVAHQNSHNSNSSYRAPLTPGGMCVVSSSTSDDIPQSPFSPDELSNHGLSNHQQGIVPGPGDNNNRNLLQGNNNINNDNQNPPPSASVQIVEHLPAVIPRGSALIASSSSSSLSSNNSTNNNRHYSHQQNGNQDLSQNAAPSTSSASSSSSSILQSFNISPLRNKIKKASSFERFSLQAAIISNAASASSSSNSSNSNGTSEPSSISSLQTITTNSSSIIGTNSNSVNVAGPSRLVWDPSPPPPLPVVVTSAPIVVAPSEPAPSSSSTSSLRSSFGGHTEKFHIKIPSKKLAAKIASVYEQEQLNESMAATLAAAEAISAVGSASNKQRPPRIPSIISNGSSSSSSLLQNNEGIINSQSQQQQQQIGPPSTLAQILNQSPSNVSASSIMTEESIMNPNEMNHERLLRELGDTPLNLTESTTTSQNHTQQQQQALLPPRNPVISSRSSLNSQASSSSSSSKKIPLTPKQKLLHRLQSGELLSLSPPPQQISQQQPIQQQQSLPIQTIQQQSISAPVVTQHQSLPMVQESMQQSITNNNNNHVIIGNVSHSPPQQLDAYGYESLLRSRDDFNVQDGLGKIGSEDPNNVSNMLSAYDADAYSYYYQNILADEIFSGNNSSSSSSNRPLLMMSSGNLQDSVDQPQGHLEFVLGLNSSVDDHENDRGREDDLQLNGDENPGSQQQFLDPNDSLNAMKSQDSTLRNLLMMEPIIRNSHPDDSWLALAAAEYQNRINSDAISRVNNSRSNTLVGGGNSSGGGGGSSSSSVSLVNISNNINNSWINEWPRTSSWQSHPSVSIGGVQDQDEVMDMSMIDHVKGSIAASQNKRIQLQMQQNNDHGGAIDDMDLGNGLPILSSMPVNMPIDLQQPISLLQHGSNSCKDTSLPMDLQQHHRMEIDDEPVNLMAVNIDQDQELIHHSSNQHVTSHHSQQSHQIHQQQQQLSDGGKGSLQQHGSSHHQQQPTSSYTLQIQSHSSSSQQELQQSMADMSSGNSNSSSDNIDERRIIRVKKNKDSLISPLDEGYQISNGQEQHENIIMDKPIQPKSIASLPSQLRLARVSGNDLAVFNNTDKNIASNCRLGPVEGPLKKANADDINNVNAPYPCLLLADVGNSLWQLDRTDDEYCNWMKFVRLAHSIKDQNSLVVESDGYLYFITCKEISPEAELQVGYSYEYAQKYGLPYLLPMEDLLEQQHENIPLKEKCNSNLRITNSPPPSSPSAIMQQQQGQDAEVKNVINVYPCFECEQEFSLLEELQAHLNTHKDPEEEIRKPKKKVLKKFQSPANNFANISTQESPRVMPNIIENLVTKEQQTGQNQLMSADSSMGAVESSSSSTTVNMDSISSQSQDLGKAQDNSVSTAGGCQPSVPPKVKCTMCYKSFATKERLEKHMIVHSDEDTKPLKCNYCTKRFLTNSALAGHIKTHAEEGKFFECPMCDFSTPQLLQLKEHVQTHKNRETGLFYCPQCPKKFSAYSMIRKHIRAFHGPRQFGCDQCPMSFPTSDKLKLHRLKHSDHREFLCAECGRQFKRKDKLREHTKRIHETKKKSIELNIPKDKNSKKFIPKVAPEEYQKFPYKCPDCMVGFKRRGMLVNHLAKKHPDKKIKSIPELNLPILRLTRNYPCLYCERVYKSSSKRKAHILKAHPGKPMPPQLRGSSAAEIRPPSSHIGTIVQTVTDDGDPRNGIMNVSCTSNISSTNGSNAAGISISSGNNLVSTTSTSTSLVLRKEAVVGKVVATPHACPWCYRQYATRAKLLQHQRKAHINLMPAEMQTPRTQKNNVAKMQSEAAATTMMDISTIKTVGTPLTSVIQSAGNNDNSLIPDSSTSSSTTTTTTIQTMAADGLSVNEANVIGFLLTTTVSASGELGSLLPSEIVMVPVQNLGNASTGTGINVLHHQTSQSQPITINSANNPSPNIAIITSSNNNSNSNNNM